VDAVLVSHAHIDHSGYLPLLVRHGFRGPIICTSATADLLPVLLRDAAHLQEEEAETANRHGYSKHKPALPLFTVQDAEAALRLLHVGRPLGNLGDRERKTTLGPPSASPANQAKSGNSRGIEDSTISKPTCLNRKVTDVEKSCPFFRVSDRLLS